MLGGCKEAQERKGDAAMVAAEEQRAGKTVKTTVFPL
jgi:hypothetical protein